MILWSYKDHGLPLNSSYDSFTTMKPFAGVSAKEPELVSRLHEA